MVPQSAQRIVCQTIIRPFLFEVENILQASKEKKTGMFFFYKQKILLKMVQAGM